MFGSDQVANIAGSILQFRRDRSQILPRDIFGEPAWELLLELFVADASGVGITGRIVAERHDVSVATISRWLKYLTEEGLLIGDGSGNPDDELTLSGTGMEKMETALAGVQYFIEKFHPQSRMAG